MQTNTKILKDVSTNSMENSFWVAILGAGIAGLQCALYLENLKEKGANLEYQLIEASSHVGGQIITQEFGQQHEFQYSDGGAMRLPISHTPVFDLIDYINHKIKMMGKHNVLKIIPFFQNGQRQIQQQTNNKLLNMFFDQNLSDFFFYQHLQINPPFSDTQLIQYGYKSEIISLIKRIRTIKIKYERIFNEQNLNPQIETSLHNQLTMYLQEQTSLGKISVQFENFRRFYSTCSLQQYLLAGSDVKYELRFDYQETLIYETYFQSAGYMQTALFEVMFEYLQFANVPLWDRDPLYQDRSLNSWYTIDGGMQKLTNSIVNLIGNDKILMNTKVDEIINEGKFVKLRFQGNKYALFDKVMVTFPMPYLNFVEWTRFNYIDQYLQQFRSATYQQLFKISLEFKYRFWEDNTVLKKDCDMVGGCCSTNLPIRKIVFPSYGFKYGPNKHGVLTIYNSNNDAIVWKQLSNEEKVDKVLNNLDKIYQCLIDTNKFADKQFRVRDYYTGQYKIFDQNIAVGLTMFSPCQSKIMKTSNKNIDDKVFFCGGHTSLYHGWILGSIQSAIVAATNMLKLSPPQFLFPGKIYHSELTKHNQNQICELRPLNAACLFENELDNLLRSQKMSLAQDFHNMYDIIVIGGGPIGLAAAFNCAKQGRKVLLLEKFNFFNSAGSSNDSVRMFRTMYTEDFLADLAYKTIPLWKDLEKEANQQLIQMTGLLNFGDPNYLDGPEGNLTGPIKNLKRLGLNFRQLTSEQIMKEYSFKNLPQHYVGIFAPDNGCINVNLTIRALHKLAWFYGVVLMQNMNVTNLKISDNGVLVTAVDNNSKHFTFSGNKCIITAGAYTNHILQSVNVKLKLKIWEMVYAYYSVNSEECRFPSMWFQFQNPIADNKSNLFYGFPSVPWITKDLV